MKNLDLCRIFQNDIGIKIYNSFIRVISKYNLKKNLQKGVLIGFSGGPDSVMLLACMKKYYKENPGGEILAVHVNHMIRGKEADHDEEFSRQLCEAENIEFTSSKFDIPSEAKRLKKGLEETARNIRYTFFNDIIQSRNSFSLIAVAHNSTDNLETVLYNMLRGSGTKGIGGIPVVRENIIRPLIYSSKDDILKALNEAQIPFVTDSTNLSSEYTRNYIRHEILPKLSKISTKPEEAITRLSEIATEDNNYLEYIAEDFLYKHSDNGKVKTELLRTLHSSILKRVLIKMCKFIANAPIEYTHLSKICNLLKKGRFSYDIPLGISFVDDGEYSYFTDTAQEKKAFFKYYLKDGLNEFPDLEYSVYISRSPIQNSFLNVYKIAIQQKIPFDIIVGDLFIRQKISGDSYVFGNMTRKLKKLFNDKNISAKERQSIPVFCDEKGILWVPRFRVRDPITVNHKDNNFLFAYILVRNNM